MEQISIRRLTSAEEMAACEAIQVSTWQMPDPLDVVPAHQLLTAAKYGGLVLGAFAGGQLVGFSYGFVGLQGSKVLLCSHMLAVLPACRGQGLGYRLKVAQAEEACRLGFDLIHWTYDPLEMVNGNLNIRRLGGIARTYLRNLYGTMNDGLNAGLPSDRLVVEWHLTSTRVREALAAGAGAPQPALESCTPYDGEGDLLDGDGPLALTIPARIQQLKQSDPAAALALRLRTRGAFERAFAVGYALTGAHGNTYILTRGGLPHED